MKFRCKKKEQNNYYSSDSTSSMKSNRENLSELSGKMVTEPGIDF
jgi:hypothetical protein